MPCKTLHQLVLCASKVEIPSATLISQILQPEQAVRASVRWVVGAGDGFTPVIWRLRLAGTDDDAFCRLRSALNDEARGAAMVESCWRNREGE